MNKEIASELFEYAQVNKTPQRKNDTGLADVNNSHDRVQLGQCVCRCGLCCEGNHCGVREYGCYK